MIQNYQNIPQEYRNIPPNYVCKRCHIPGHHIRLCPTNGDKDFETVKAATGIPRSKMRLVLERGTASDDTMVLPGVGQVAMIYNESDWNTTLGVDSEAVDDVNILETSTKLPQGGKLTTAGGNSLKDRSRSRNRNRNRNKNKKNYNENTSTNVAGAGVHADGDVDAETAADVGAGTDADADADADTDANTDADADANTNTNEDGNRDADGSTSLLCTICGKVVQKPQRLKCCSTLGCSTCLRTALMQRFDEDNGYTCPYCNAHLQTLHTALVDDTAV
uniref:E3 ubiquitin-protein ligase RBBP6 n=1 Tax=Lygus hesperus TaxID=30085 RepID=A0A0A9YV23_LYGHE